MIDPNKPFVLYANCNVTYSGRASSYLENGNYLIIYKEDKSLLIHGSTKITPKNYQGSCSKLTIDNNKIISKRKQETIIINVNEEISCNQLLNWSDNEINIINTENDLVNKLLDNWYDYIDAELEIIYREYQTDLGSIDLLGVDNKNIHHIIEAKRTIASINHCSQLLRYIECFNDIGVETVGYIASPKINKNAIKYLEKHNCKWIKIEF